MKSRKTLQKGGVIMVGGLIWMAICFSVMFVMLYLMWKVALEDDDE